MAKKNKKRKQQTKKGQKEISIKRLSTANKCNTIVSKTYTHKRATKTRNKQPICQ